MKTRLEVIADATKKYGDCSSFPKEITKELLCNELARINEIASGEEFYDYRDQRWIAKNTMAWIVHPHRSKSQNQMYGK